MLVKEIRSIASQYGIKAGKMSKTELIHNIQEAEGNTPCFATAVNGDCDQYTCIWREDCFKLAKKVNN